MNIKRINNNTKIENSVNLKSNKTPEIPEDWVECVLEEIICKNGIFSDGDWIESKDQDLKGEVRLIQLADIGDGSFRNKSKRFMTLKKAQELKCTFLEQGDILIARMPEPLGRCSLFPLEGKHKFVTVVDIAILRSENQYVLNKFLLFQINSPIIRSEIDKLKSGTTRKRISRKNLNKIEFKFPPLPIQRAIVQKIESLFSSLDSGIADLKKAQEQLTIYRQAVLKKAFEEPQGFIKKPVIHKDVLLSEICEMQAGKFVKASNISQENIGNMLFPCYGGNGLRGYVEGYTHDGIFSLIGRQGALCGNVHLVNGKFHATEHAVVVNSDNTVDKVWLFYKLSSMKLNQFSTGVAQPGLAVRTLNSLSIKLPSMDVQRIIVREIESRLSVCDAVEKNIANSLEKAESLRQSILKKAFEGKLLTANEIEQCKQEPDYEPAKKLLEQIKSGG